MKKRHSQNERQVWFGFLSDLGLVEISASKPGGMGVLPPGKSRQSLETFLIFMTREGEGY